MQKKTAKLKVTFLVDYSYPEDWDDDMLLFHLNDSSFCSNNLLTDKLAEEDCICSPFDVEIYREV
jgi:hypothetical protein